MSQGENVALPTGWPIPSFLPSISLSGNTYETISLVCGYVSIACWICVFTPQLYQNYCRKSGESLSVSFLVIWLFGDLFNVAGVLMQGLLDTMLVLAIYYTAADIGLIIQVYYYRYLGNPEDKDEEADLADITDDLLNLEASDATQIVLGDESSLIDMGKRTEQVKEMRMKMTYDPTRSMTGDSTISSATLTPSLVSTAVPGSQRCRASRTVLVVSAVSLVLIGCAIVVGISEKYVTKQDETERRAVKHHFTNAYRAFSATMEERAVDPMAQLMGWISAALYVGSRIPQLIKNFKSKSCEGLSGAMFSMSVFGNVTYSLSILVMLPVIAKSAMEEDRSGDPDGGEAVYTYLTKTLPWLVGSAGTLLFDFSILVQFLIYRKNANDTDEEQQPTERSPLLREITSAAV